MDPRISPELEWLVGAALVLFVAGMYALSFWARGRIHGAEDFIVAGRRLSLPLASATLLATWFGAGTMLTAADEVRLRGLQQISLEPVGSGVCLLLAGFFFARRLWRMGLLTISDFFRLRFGPRSEVYSALVMVPSFFGWIAAQFIALAGMLQLFFGIDLNVGILVVALVGGGYTWLGGMWSVTLTDAVQVVLVLGGLLILGVATLGMLGDGSLLGGAERLLHDSPPEMLVVVPTESLSALVGWIGVFCVAALGNIPGQDLMQRIFAARSEGVAQRACWLAGLAYIFFGLIPVTLGLASRLIFPEDLEQAIIPALAHAFLNPGLGVVFTLALASAVLSTIDSAILAPASVLAQNLAQRWNRGRLSLLALTRLSVVVVTGASLGLAYLGESAYALLEDAYALTLVGLLVPLAFGLYRTPNGEGPALVAMTTGTSLWLLHYVAGWDEFLQPWGGWWDFPLPVALTATILALLAYLVADRLSAGSPFVPPAPASP